MAISSRFLGLFLIVLMTISYSCKKDELPNDEQIRNYLTENGIDAIEHESGLYYIITKPGIEDEYPNVNSKVSVLYKGYLLDGTVFDQTVTQQPITFQLEGVISGWRIGIPLMEKKSKGTFFIPSNLAYGSNPPSGSKIPKNAVLVFDIELFDFE